MTEIESLDVVQAQVQRRLESQIRNHDSLDTKAGLVVGIAALVLTRTDLIQSLVGRMCMIAAIGGFLTALVSLHVRTLRNDPDPRGLMNGYLHHSVQKVKIQLISNMVESFDFNARVLARKARLLRIAVYMLVLSIIFYLGGLYV